MHDICDGPGKQSSGRDKTQGKLSTPLTGPHTAGSLCRHCFLVANVYVGMSHASCLLSEDARMCFASFIQGGYYVSIRLHPTERQKREYPQKFSTLLCSLTALISVQVLLSRNKGNIVCLNPLITQGRDRNGCILKSFLRFLLIEYIHVFR